MPGFELTFSDVQPFDGIDMPIEVRVSGTYADLDSWDLDYVEAPSRFDPSARHNPRDGWRVIDRLHVLRRGNGMSDGIDRFLERRSSIDAIEAEIRRLMEDDGQPIADPHAEHRLGKRELVGA